MAATKTSTTFTWASGSATSTGTTNAISTSTLYAQTVYARIIQVGTATTAAFFQIVQSPDGGTTTYGSPTYGAQFAAATYTWVIQLDTTCTSVFIVYGAQSGGTSSTISLQLGEVTGI